MGGRANFYINSCDSPRGCGMRFLISVIILVGFAFIVFSSLVTVLWELSLLGFQESPVIREWPGGPGELAAAEDPKEVESYESSPTELGDTH